MVLLTRKECFPRGVSPLLTYLHNIGKKVPFVDFVNFGRVHKYRDDRG